MGGGRSFFYFFFIKFTKKPYLHIPAGTRQYSTLGGKNNIIKRNYIYKHVIINLELPSVKKRSYHLRCINVVLLEKSIIDKIVLLSKLYYCQNKEGIKLWMNIVLSAKFTIDNIIVLLTLLYN